MNPYLIIGITYAFAAATQPGPLQAYLISQSLSKGWKQTLPAVFSPLLSDIPIIILTLLLLSKVNDNFIPILRGAGGFFLIYLSVRSFIT
ncbi:MAG: LysE family transporter [Deltaproteobacteria bacterium]|nr:LysE family transporter [Deltaproteobacteria bacterium]